MKGLVELLQKLESWVESIPPVDNKLSRFGNPAFRTWYDRAAQVNGKFKI